MPIVARSTPMFARRPTNYVRRASPYRIPRRGMGQPAGCVMGSAPGQCPMAADGSCTDAYGNPGQSCVLIRECDACTGAQHVNYALPSGIVPEAGAWTMQSNGQWVYLGSNGQPTTPPAGEAPPTTQGGVFTSEFNPAAQAIIAAAGGTPYTRAIAGPAAPAPTPAPKPTPPPAAPPVVPKPPAQSNAPAPTVLGGGTAQSNAPPSNVPPSTSGFTCWKLFSATETCFGPVGSFTGIAAAGAIGLLFWLFGGKR